MLASDKGNEQRAFMFIRRFLILHHTEPGYLDG